MKTREEIDVKEILSLEDFITLFNHLPLNEQEKQEVISDYYPMYKLFIESEVKAEDSWLAIRNLYVMKNQQIAKRISDK
jgi:hypothetical protein